MKQKIVLEHRQALDAMEAAKSNYNTCRRRGQCDNEKNCVTCPAALNYQAKKVVFDEKATALNKINEQIIEHQHNKAIVKINERMKERSQKTMKATSKPLYKREDLTVERYRKHREVDELKDREIREMYGFPTSSFDKWKRDNNQVRVAQQAKAADPAPKEAVNSQDEPSYKQQYEQAKTKYDDLLGQHLKLQQELETASNQNNEKQKALKSTEEELQQVKETVYSFQAEINSLIEEREYFKDQVEQLSGVVGELRAQIATLTVENDDDRMEAFERQFQIFDRWETMMLERMLQMKRAN